MEGLSKQKRRRGAAKPAGSQWRSTGQRLSYTADLVHALRRVRRTSSPSPSSSRAVREAADRILATAARGRTRWSTAILATRRPVKLRRRRCSSRQVFIRGRSSNTFTELERKLKTLGRLVPGCCKLPLSALLKETSDYIAALEMQVQAMGNLAQFLSSINQPDSL